MRKMMLLLSMVAMVMVAAVPALAQDAGVSGDGTANGGDVTTTDTQYQNQASAIVQDCSVTVNQGQYGDASGDGATITTTIGDVTGAQCQAIINQVQAGNDAVGAVNAVLGDGTVAAATDTADTTVVADTNGVDDNGDGVVDESGETAVVAADSSSSAAASSSSSADSSSSASESTSVLPDTGGASLFTLGAGALLVGGGLLARRIFS